MVRESTGLNFFSVFVNRLALPRGHRKKAIIIILEQFLFFILGETSFFYFRILKLLKNCKLCKKNSANCVEVPLSTIDIFMS